jgi:outer membrane protein OmpA-like peptidoglycan-associated protein
MRRRVGLLWLVGLACAPRPAPPPPLPAAVNAPPPPAAPARPADRDGDGIPDDKDQCPEAPETINGCRDDDGCPDRIVVGPLRRWPKILDQIFFAAGSAKVRSAEPPHVDMIAVVAATLKMNPDIGPIEVRGHAAPNERQPARLSEARAVAVLEGLVARGVPRERLSARGLGASQPACAHDNEECWSRSRRVEFSLVRQPPPPPPFPGGPYDCGRVLL